jgi:hypothetical protein
VRLEAEVASGQLELRATVVDDDGRLSTFRRLDALVRGPQGFSKRIALEAAGAGSYRAALPLEAPGSYVASAVDAVDGGVVATAGAALGLGDELRPTGSDAAALARLAELTGGKRRDTLAGIFADRGPRRFNYEDMTTGLLAVAAFSWLGAVAARRLAFLDEPLFANRKVRPPVAAVPQATDLAASSPEGTLAALVSRRNESALGVARAPAEPTPERANSPATDALGPRGAADASAAVRPTAPRVVAEPRVVTPDPAGSVPTADRGPAPREATSADVGAVETDATGRALTAAEILLARRKNRR